MPSRQPLLRCPGHTKLVIDYVAGMEARGFIFASALANHIRASGLFRSENLGNYRVKPSQENYGLEYGTDTLEIHKDSCAPGYERY